MELDGVDTAEVVTGLKVLQHLVEKNESQIKSSQSKIGDYTELQEVLNSVIKQSRRQVLAPVAEGLAYFDAELVCTNNILLLLGENWFSERSVSQAIEIAERRLEFLRREVQVLEQEKKMLKQRQGMFFSEISDTKLASVNLTNLAKDCCSEPLVGPDGGYGATDNSRQSSKNLTVTQLVPSDSVDKAAASNPHLAVFDEQDDLTDEELAELEKELAGVLDNDEIVERALITRMIAKKEKRVQMELSRAVQSRIDTSLEIGQTSMGGCPYPTRTPQPTKEEHRISPQTTALSSECVFASPADIDFRESTTPAAIGSTASMTPSLMGSSAVATRATIPKKRELPNKERRKVKFVDEDTRPEKGFIVSVNSLPSISTQETKCTSDGVSFAPQIPRQGLVLDSTAPERKTFAVRDILERVVDSGSELMRVGEPKPTMSSTKKRISLFKQELEGKNDFSA